MSALVCVDSYSHEHRFRRGRADTCLAKNKEKGAKIKDWYVPTAEITKMSGCLQKNGLSMLSEDGCANLNIEAGGSPFLKKGKPDEKIGMLENNMDWDQYTGVNAQRRTLYWQFNKKSKKKEERGVCMNANTQPIFGGKEDIEHPYWRDPKYAYIWNIFFFQNQFDDEDNRYFQQTFMAPKEWLKCTPSANTRCFYHGQLIYERQANNGNGQFKTCVWKGSTPAYDASKPFFPVPERAVLKYDVPPVDPSTKECAFIEDLPKEEIDALEALIPAKSKTAMAKIKDVAGFKIARTELVQARFNQKSPIPPEVTWNCNLQMKYEVGPCYLSQYEMKGKWCTPSVGSTCILDSIEALAKKHGAPSGHSCYCIHPSTANLLVKEEWDAMLTHKTTNIDRKTLLPKEMPPTK